MTGVVEGGTVPKVRDPGGAGWPEEPKGVTDAERMLFGELAGVVRLLGQTAVAAEHAYMLTCKHLQEDEDFRDGEQQLAYDEAVRVTYQVYESAMASYREVAAKAAAMHGRMTGLVLR